MKIFIFRKKFFNQPIPPPQTPHPNLINTQLNNSGNKSAYQKSSPLPKVTSTNLHSSLVQQSNTNVYYHTQPPAFGSSKLLDFNGSVSTGSQNIGGTGNNNIVSALGPF
jgi:hypothetical protein